MKLKYEIIVNNHFKSGVAKVNTLDLPVSAAMQIVRVVEEAEKHLTTYDKTKSKIINKYKVKQEDGTEILPKESIESYNNDIIELSQQEFDYKLGKIAITVPKTFTLQPAEAYVLKNFFNIGVEE